MAAGSAKRERGEPDHVLATTPAIALEEIARLEERLLASARGREDRRLFTGRGQQHYAAWIYGICLAAEEALRLDRLAAQYLFNRTFRRIFGARAEFLRITLEMQADVFGPEIATGRRAYAWWDGKGPLVYHAARARTAAA